MKPTEILMAEHRVIEQVLACLDRIIDRAAGDGRLDLQDAGDAIAFLQNFADKCHHGKEENHLFPAMEARGFARQSGPIGVMLYEHDEGRGHIRGMVETLPGAAAGEQVALTRFAQHGRAYSDLLRAHIAKEDQILFQMADRALSPADQQELMARFQHVEKEDMGQGTHEKYLALANRLADRYGVIRSTVAVGSCGCGHS